MAAIQGFSTWFAVKKIRFFILVVFAPRVFAFNAAEESGLRLISRSKLTKPPFCCRAPTFRTFCSESWERSDIIRFINNDDFLLYQFIAYHHIFCIFFARFFSMSALFAPEETF